MKAEELTACAACGHGMMHHGSPLFYRVTVEPLVIDVAAARRRHGEELMMGPLAGVLGRQEDVAVPVEGAASTKLLCSSCLLSGLPVATLIGGD